MTNTSTRINLDEPRYDQSTFSGRAKHFVITTNPFNIFATSKQLDEAKSIVERYRAGEELQGMSEDAIWAAKNLYDSAFHPDTKEKMFILGRMSAQVPCNMSITGCMLTFFRTTKEVVFWQWFNQTFNAIVNYTNRSGETPLPNSQLALSYTLATGGAVGTALTINKLVKRFPPIVARFVPFTAVAAANCINIPCMRSRELIDGIPVFDANGNRIGDSKRAAESAIAQVMFSRILMATPGMVIPPVIMQHLETKKFMKARPWLNAPLQVSLVGFVLIFATPLCCALFPQKSSLSVSKLEHDLQEKVKTLPHSVDRVYFNKGL
ncbi:sideroflexin-1-like [Mya arenaria]|uniref:sideroflexin-1-like n=1 Tax=Mya arenaria TaxID=6604 RepID=UPI0022DFE80B|nr:sideroflexin-1-like [Mya arenaria]XP_052772546.1 sideroflexin-1-like [Mya arenaria]